MQSFFTFIYNILAKRRALVLGLTALITALSLYVGQKLEMEESITALLPADDSIVADQLLIYGNFDYNNRLFMEVAFNDGASGELDELIEIADELYEKLAASQLFSTITYKTDDELVGAGFNLLATHYPVLSGPEQLEELPKLLTKEAISEQLAQNRRFLMETPGELPKQMVLSDPLNLRRLYWPVLLTLQGGMTNELYQGAVVSNDRRAIMLVAQTDYPATVFSKTAPMLDKVDEIIAALLKDKPKGRVVVNYTGAHPAVRDNNVMIRRDIGLTVAVSLIAITLLVFLAYRRKYMIFYSYLPVIFGGALGLAIFSLFSSEIQGVVVGFSAVLIGISVDYAIHILYRYDCAAAGQKTAAILAPLATPIMIGAATTISAFLCLNTSMLPGQRQLGVVASLGILSAMFFSLFILPHLLPAVSSEKRPPKLALNNLMERYFRWYDSHKKWPALIVLTLWIVALTGINKVQIDGDMRHLSGTAPKTLKQENTITARWGQELLGELLLVVSAPTMDEVAKEQQKLLPILQKLRKNATISNFSTPAMLLPPENLQKEHRAAFAKIIAKAQNDGLTDYLPAAAQEAGFKKEAFSQYMSRLLTSAESALITPEELKEAMPDVFKAYYSKGPSGEYLGLTRVTLSPENAQKAVDILSADLQKLHWYHGQLYTNHLSKIVTSSMWTFGLVSLLVVCLIVFLALGRAELLLLVIYAMGSAMAWTFGIMGHIGVPINLMSSLFVVFVFGMSVDYVVFVINDMLETRQGAKSSSKGTTSGAIILSALTTIAALGSLALASHPAMNSVGFTAAIGMASGMIAALLAVPLFVRPIAATAPGKAPVTLVQIINTFCGYTVFILGAILGTIILYPLLWLILRRRQDKLETALNKYLQIICRLALIAIPFGKINLTGLKYLQKSSPAIYIANHESMLDIVILEAFLPKQRMVVKKWVWDVPFMGFMVRKAGFLLVDDNHDLLERAEKLIKAGINILIFPEGSRQIERTLGRFHKGAFELALKEDIPIQPVLLAESRSSIAKGSPFIGRFAIEVVIMPPETLSGTSREAASHFREIINSAYEKARSNLAATPAFRRELMAHYAYTGPYNEQYIFWKMAIDPIFRHLPGLLPSAGTILDIGTGYGLMANILAYESPLRQIWALDYDAGKLAIAAKNSMYPQNSTYICGDMFSENFPEKAAGALLIDVTHYWPQDKQLEIFKKIALHLQEGGILLFRDGCRDESHGYKNVKFFEKLATGIGHNKSAHELTFLSKSEYLKLLETAGFTVEKELPELGLGTNLTFVCRKK